MGAGGAGRRPSAIGGTPSTVGPGRRVSGIGMPGGGRGGGRGDMSGRSPARRQSGLATTPAPSNGNGSQTPTTTTPATTPADYSDAITEGSEDQERDSVLGRKSQGMVGDRDSIKRSLSSGIITPWKFSFNSGKHSTSPTPASCSCWWCECQYPEWQCHEGHVGEVGAGERQGRRGGKQNKVKVV